MAHFTKTVIVFFAFVSVSFAQNDTAEFFTVVEQMPEFNGGNVALIAFIEKNIEYPISEKKELITGTVFCSFVVDNSGMVTSVSVLRGVPNHPNFDNAAISMIKKMPKWVPGKQNGKPVSVKFTLPIKFALPNK